MNTGITTQELPGANPIGWGKQQVQEFAEKVAVRLGYKSGADLTTIIDLLHGKVEHRDWSSARDTGSIVVRGPSDFTIFLSPFSGGRRSRFTIAHELGHYILHSRLGRKPLCVARDGGGRAEWEANWFAAGFLMPAKEFQQKKGEGYGDAELAEHFQVSEEAVRIRSGSL